MRKTPPVARLRLPPERESPPERVLVAADAPAKAPVESMEKSSPPAELTNCRKSPVAEGVLDAKMSTVGVEVPRSSRRALGFRYVEAPRTRASLVSLGLRKTPPSVNSEEPEPPTQLSPMAKQPEVRVMPWARVEVAEPVSSRRSPLKFPDVLILEEKEEVAEVPPPTEMVPVAERCPDTLRFSRKVEEAVEMRPAKLASPVPVITSAVMSEEPMEMLPKPEAREPEGKAPTVTRPEAVVMPVPREVASSTLALLMRKTPPVARLRLPPERESPPERVLVAADAPAKAPVESMEKSSPPAELTNCRKSPVAEGVLEAKMSTVGVEVPRSSRRALGFRYVEAPRTRASLVSLGLRKTPPSVNSEEPEPPTQLSQMAKQPEVRVMPWARVEVAERCPVTLRFSRNVEEAVEMRPAKLASPVPVITSAVMSEEPMEMLPKPEAREPEVKALTVTRPEAVVMPVPREVASSTLDC